MPQLRPLRLQVQPVVRAGRDLERLATRDRQTVALKADDLARIVRQQTDRAEPEIEQDLRADAVVTQVRLEPERLVCLDRVLTLVLELVRPDLVGEADAASFLPQIDDGAAALLVDAAQRGVQLLTAVTAQRGAGVARQTLRVQADEHILLALELPLRVRDGLLMAELFR